MQILKNLNQRKVELEEEVNEAGSSIYTVSFSTGVLHLFFVESFNQSYEKRHKEPDEN